MTTGFIGLGIGARYEFTTQNSINNKFEYNSPIQSVRFIKPVEKIIFPTDVPAFVHCENRIIYRLRNRILGIPTPRIMVKQFTERGIIFDEENTYGIDAVLELTPLSPQFKQGQSTKDNSQGL
ncbi:MAG: hypothetical protein ABSA18_07435 [Dehalococcoidia bacterium]